MNDSVAAAIRDAAERLAATSDTARLDAELLMAHALGASRSDMLLKFMGDAEPAEFAGLVERRAQREPVAYIVGHQEFYGREFLVTPDVLIPRSDSETLIDAALDLAPPPTRILDLGTGSGCLLVTMLAELPEANGVGIDASLAAVPVAAANAARLGVANRAQILRRSWRDPRWNEGLGRFDLVLANPPYVEVGASLDPSVRQFEPPQALFAGPDGLDDYRLIIPQLREMMTESGSAILEIGASQRDQVSQIATQAAFDVQWRQDLAGRDRAIILT